MIKSIAKTGLSLSLLLVVAATSCSEMSEAYKVAREQFKESLCRSQGGLMSRSGYLEFIEPHLQKAEKELAIPQHLQKKQQLNDDDMSYMRQLASCNVALFHRVANPNNSYAENGYERCKSSLRSKINYIAFNDGLKVDAYTEFDKTEKILTDANVKFRQKLGFVSKALLFWYA